MKSKGNEKTFRILVADDDAAILDATSMILKDEGYVVRTTSDGQTIRMLKRDLPDLVLLDIWMSGQDGRDILPVYKK